MASSSSSSATLSFLERRQRRMTGQGRWSLEANLQRVVTERNLATATATAAAATATNGEEATTAAAVSVGGDKGVVMRVSGGGGRMETVTISVTRQTA